MVGGLGLDPWMLCVLPAGGAQRKLGGWEEQCAMVVTEVPDQSGPRIPDIMLHLQVLYLWIPPAPITDKQPGKGQLPP